MIGSAVLTFIGYKQTNRQTDRQTDKPNLYIDIASKYSIDKPILRQDLFVVFCQNTTYKYLDRAIMKDNT